MLESFRRYLLARGNSHGTIVQRIGDVRRLQHEFPDLQQLAAEQLERWLATKTNIWAPEYNKRQRTSNRIFFAWAVDRGHVNRNPTTTLSSVRVPRSVAKPIPEASLLSAFAFATLHERAILALGATEGLRRVEIATSQPKNRHDEYLTVVGKNRDERVVPLDETTLIRNPAPSDQPIRLIPSPVLDA